MKKERDLEAARIRAARVERRLTLDEVLCFIEVELPHCTIGGGNALYSDRKSWETGFQAAADKIAAKIRAMRRDGR